jgi:hypothetical protein
MKREVAIYGLISALLLGASGVVASVVYPLAIPEAPHEGVAVLYVMSAAAFTEGFVCDRWFMVIIVFKFIGSLISTLAGGLGAAGPGAGGLGGADAVAEVQERFNQMGRQIEDLKAQLETETQARLRESDVNAERIAQLEKKLEAATSLSVRMVTGGVLDLGAFALGIAASLLWVTNKA